MLFPIVLIVVAVTVAVVALQNGQAAPISFLFWQFQAPVALIVLASTAAGLAIGGLVGFARAVGRWSRRQGGPQAGDRDSGHPAEVPRAAHDHRPGSRTPQ